MKGVGFKLQRGQKEGIWKEKQWQIPFQTWGESIEAKSSVTQGRQEARSPGKDKGYYLWNITRVLHAADMDGFAPYPAGVGVAAWSWCHWQLGHTSGKGARGEQDAVQLAQLCPYSFWRVESLSLPHLSCSLERGRMFAWGQAPVFLCSYMLRTQSGDCRDGARLQFTAVLFKTNQKNHHNCSSLHLSRALGGCACPLSRNKAGDCLCSRLPRAAEPPQLCCLFCHGQGSVLCAPGPKEGAHQEQLRGMKLCQRPWSLLPPFPSSGRWRAASLGLTPCCCFCPAAPGREMDLASGAGEQWSLIQGSPAAAHVGAPAFRCPVFPCFLPS